MARLELFGTARCPYTQEYRDWLQWLGCEFDEFDVEADGEAQRRLLALCGGRRRVPVLVEDNCVVAIGWQGCWCTVDPERYASKDEHSQHWR